MIEKMKSRKLWITVLTATLAALNAGLGNPIPPDTVESIMQVVMIYLGGQGIVDATAAYKKGG